MRALQYRPWCSSKILFFRLKPHFQDHVMMVFYLNAHKTLTAIFLIIYIPSRYYILFYGFLGTQISILSFLQEGSILFKSLISSFRALFSFSIPSIYNDYDTYYFLFQGMHSLHVLCIPKPNYKVFTDEC